MNNFVLSVDADVDLDDIWDYIAADNIDSADRWIEKLFDAFEALGRTPGMGIAGKTSRPFGFCSGQLVRTSSSTAPSGARFKLWP